MRLILTALATVAAVGFAYGPMGAAQANTITCDFLGGNGNGNGNGNGGGDQDTTYTLILSGAAACGVSGNDDAAAIGDIPGVFEAPPEWTFAFKNEGGNNGGGDGAIKFTTAPTNGTQGGDWAIDFFPELTQIAVVLKAGNSFAAFLLSPFTNSGTWTTDRGLSHASIYYRSCEVGDPGCGVRDDEPPVAPIPLPAAGWLLLGGLGALAAVRRRKKAA